MFDVLSTVALPLVLMGLRIRQVWPYTVDDAFILVRYGRNLAAGHGLTFNPGWQPVEGYSNLVSVLLAAAAETFGVPAIVVLKALGVAAGLLCPAAVWWLVLRSGGSRWAARGAAVAMAAVPGFVFWSVAGLETAPTALLVTLAAAIGLRGRALDDALVVFVMLLVSLMRPEGPVLMAFLACALVLVDHAGGMGWPAVAVRLLRLAGPFAVLYGAYFTARWWTFGVLFPNPIYFKTLTAESSWRDSMAVEFAASWWPLMALAALAAALPGNPRRRLVAGVFACGFLIYARTQHFVVGGIGTMAFFDRYFLHVLPFLIAAGALAVGDLFERVRSAPARMTAAASAAGLLLWLWIGPGSGFAEMCFASVPSRSEIPNRIAAVADYVNSRYGGGAVVAVGDVGRNGVALEGNIHDIFGLTSYEFTQRFGRDLDRYVDWIIAEEPDCFLILAELAPGGFRPSYTPEIRILGSADVREGYRIGARLGLEPGSPLYYMVIERRDELERRGETGETWWVAGE
jgi:hypothetical protein